MTQFTFRSAKGIEVTVEAETESMARSRAMYRLWGLPHGWCQNRGDGLHLREQYRKQGESDYDNI